MLNWLVAVAAIIIFSGIDMYLFKSDPWSMYESLSATILLAIFLKIKD